MTGEPFQITRTRSKNYVGVCMVEGCDVHDGGPFTTARIHNRVRAALMLRDHCRTEHDIHTGNLFLETPKEERMAMKQPTGTPIDPNEKLGDYVDHLIVIRGEDRGAPFNKDTVHGARRCIEATVDVFYQGNWKTLGVVPIFYTNVIKEVVAAGDDDLGGMLRQGIGTGKDRTWHLDPVSANDKGSTAALKAWDPKKTEAF